jgi:segregation and condensation protein B
VTPTSPSDPEITPEELERVLEAILFAHEGPVTIEMLAEAMHAAEPQAIRAAITSLGRDYERTNRSFEIVKVAGGYQICTREQWAPWVARFQRGSRRARLSRAAVETLAIIAYRQPITRTTMEEIRGVDSGAVLHTLLERNLITVKGRGKGIGRPLLYGTTSEFLEYFGLDRLEDLPRLDEIESLLKERETEEPVEELESTALELGSATASFGDEAETTEAKTSGAASDEAEPDETETDDTESDMTEMMVSASDAVGDDLENSDSSV